MRLTSCFFALFSQTLQVAFWEGQCEWEGSRPLHPKPAPSPLLLPTIIRYFVASHIGLRITWHITWWNAIIPGLGFFVQAPPSPCWGWWLQVWRYDPWSLDVVARNFSKHIVFMICFDCVRVGHGLSVFDLSQWAGSLAQDSKIVGSIITTWGTSSTGAQFHSFHFSSKTPIAPFTKLQYAPVQQHWYPSRNWT